MSCVRHTRVTQASSSSYLRYCHRYDPDPTILQSYNSKDLRHHSSLIRMRTCKIYKQHVNHKCNDFAYELVHHVFSLFILIHHENMKTSYISRLIITCVFCYDVTIGLPAVHCIKLNFNSVLNSSRPFYLHLFVYGCSNNYEDVKSISVDRRRLHCRMIVHHNSSCSNQKT